MNEFIKSNAGDQSIQSDQYEFPYHYVPQFKHPLHLSRYWGFASSYVAAIGIVVELLRNNTKADSRASTHIDIGCGDGALIYYLSSILGLEKFEFSGIDIDERALGWAKKFNPNARLHSGSLDDLKGQTYQSASLIEVLEHIPPAGLESFLLGVKRLVRSEGLIVVTVPSVEKPVSSKHYQHFGFNEISDILEKFFEIDKVYGFERHNIITRTIEKFRSNRYFRIDAPILNSVLVKQLGRLYRRQSGCGRILIVCKNRF